MPRIADYVVITDSRFGIEAGEDMEREFGFLLEGGADLPSPAILVFFVFIEQGGANSLVLEVTINGSQQFTRSFTGFRSNTLHEVVDRNTLQAGENLIVFRITGGFGCYASRRCRSALPAEYLAVFSCKGEFIGTR